MNRLNSAYYADNFALFKNLKMYLNCLIHIYNQGVKNYSSNITEMYLSKEKTRRLCWILYVKKS